MVHRSDGNTSEKFRSIWELACSCSENLNQTDVRYNAQASLAIKKIISQRRPPPGKQMDIESQRTHFEKHFTKLSSTRVKDFPVSFLQLLSKREMVSAVRDLKNNKAPGPDGLTSEDMKKRRRETFMKKLNMLIRKKR